jgi:thioester reductase-like protein
MSNNKRPPASPDSFPPLAEIFNQRRLLLTGATGFLGKVLLFLLLRDHQEIGRLYLLIRGDSKSSLNRFRREILDSPAINSLRGRLGGGFDRYVEERVSVVCGDLAEADLLSGGQSLAPGSIDAVIHCAGLVNSRLR